MPAAVLQDVPGRDAVTFPRALLFGGCGIPGVTTPGEEQSVGFEAF